MQCSLAGWTFVAVICLCLLAGTCRATELEFELKDNDVQCFHEEIERDKRCFLEFQVPQEQCLILQ